MLVQLAAIQWASRDLGSELRGVELGSDGAWVMVGDVYRQARFGPIVYATDDGGLIEQLVQPAGLAAPGPGPAVPVIPELGAAWRHFWAELLQGLGVYQYALRDGGSTRRYEAVHLDEQNTAAVTVVDATGDRWITRIALDPPRVDMLGAPFDIPLWINAGQGLAVDGRTKILELPAPGSPTLY